MHSFVACNSSVVLVDELDQFITQNQKVIYNFFDWPNRKGSKLIVIAIANTMDLPERVMLNRVSSRIGIHSFNHSLLGLTRLNFAPYNYKQLIEIIRMRLQGSNRFKPEAIEVCARKVGSVSGDARRALEICRYALSLKTTTVDVNVILRAVKELNASSSLVSLASATVHELILMASIVKRIRLSGVSAVDLSDVVDEHLRICETQSIDNPPINALLELANSLSHYGWIIVESKRKLIDKKVHSLLI